MSQKTTTSAEQVDGFLKETVQAIQDAVAAKRRHEDDFMGMIEQAKRQAAANQQRQATRWNAAAARSRNSQATIRLTCPAKLHR